MTLIRWQPLREIDSLQKEMNRLFDDFYPTDLAEGNFDRSSFVPAAEMSQTPEAIDLKVEIPGLEAKDLDVEVEADSVRIKGERKLEEKTEENGTIRTEFRYGKFHRVIPLPTRVQNNNVTAEYKDGMLNLHLPLAEEERNKVVKVNIE